MFPALSKMPAVRWVLSERMKEERLSGRHLRSLYISEGQAGQACLRSPVRAPRVPDGGLLAPEPTLPLSTGLLSRAGKKRCPRRCGHRKPYLSRGQWLGSRLGACVCHEPVQSNLEGFRELWTPSQSTSARGRASRAGAARACLPQEVAPGGLGWGRAAGQDPGLRAAGCGLRGTGEQSVSLEGRDLQGMANQSRTELLLANSFLGRLLVSGWLQGGLGSPRKQSCEGNVVTNGDRPGQMGGRRAWHRPGFWLTPHRLTAGAGWGP